MAAQRDSAKSEAEAAKGEALTAKASAKQSLEAAQSQLGPLQQELATAKAAVEQGGLVQSILRAGIMDEEGIGFAQLAYSAVPVEGRPPIDEWLKSDALPKAVRVYLPVAEGSPPGGGAEPSPSPAPSQPVQPPAPAQPAQPGAFPPANAGVPTRGTTVRSAAQISALPNPTYKEERPRILAEYYENKSRQT